MLHMLSNTIGPKFLQLGLQDYIKKYAFKNAIESNLWDAINNVSNFFSIPEKHFVKNYKVSTIFSTTNLRH